MTNSEAIKISKEIQREGGCAKARLMDKCRWEKMGWIAVIMEWGDPRTWGDAEHES